MQSQPNTQTITAFFDSRDHAESAVETLTNAGISSDAIQMIEGNDPAAGSASPAKEDKGFVDSVRGLFMPDEDRQSYAEGCGAAAIWSRSARNRPKRNV